jgi:taurine dioxygenase
MTLEILPVSPVVGAEIRGIDASRPVDRGTARRLYDAWLEHCVLLLRGQSLDDEALVDFSRHFGDLELAPANEYTKKGNTDMAAGRPEVAVISNVKVEGKPIGALGNLESVWHTDMSYDPEPPKASLLYSLEVPSSGGDTGFSNMYAAYADLPDTTKARIAGLVAVHDNSLTSAGTLRKGFSPVTDVTQTPGARHPIVRTHPETGRPALFLGRRKNQYIPGLDVAESEALLDDLWAHATQPKYAWHHKWAAGDLLLWDNRCVMHRRDAFDDTTRRIMHRTQIRGDRPYSAVA